ncbi:MAG: TonB-dependent receptor, partial [Candidatus Hydrogenedentales bacterium]
IEIIRGPGSALWGANAVNGVINIVTKDAAETQGGLVVLGGGDQENFFNTLRYGGALSDDAFYRVYAKYFTRDQREFASGEKANDAWRMYQTGFRIDWDLTIEDKLSIQADAYDNRSDQTQENAFLFFPHRRVVNGRSDREGGNVLLRWEREISETSDFHMQVFVEQVQDEDPTVVGEWRRLYDLDFHHRLQIGDRHEVVWGAGVRYWHDDIDNTRFISYHPEERTDFIYSAFVQDEVSLTEELSLILGAKFEFNNYTGFEFQPNIRAAWTPNDRQTLWAAIARAVRTPSRAEDDVHILNRVFPGRISLVLEGNQDFESEDLMAYEIGYRHGFSENLFLDLALFYNDYSDLRTIEVIRPRIALRPFPWHFNIPAEARNNLKAETYGFEAVVNWQPKPWWQLEASYSFLEINLDFHTRTPDFITRESEGDTPEQQWVLQNYFQLPANLALDTTLRWVDRLPTLGVDDYFNLDVQLRWQPRDNLEFALVGQNLLESGRTEFAPTFVNTTPTEVERNFYGKVTWRF